MLPGGKATVVGIEAAPGEFPPQIQGTGDVQIHASPALLPVAADLIGIETGGNSIEVRLRDGEAGVDAFIASLHLQAPDASAGTLVVQRALTASASRSMHTQATALRLLALLTGLAGIIVAAQLMARLTTVESDDQPVLSALGMTRRDRFRIGMARATVIGASAAVAATAVALAASGLFPSGLAGLAEPDRGIRIDPTVLALGGAGVLAAVVMVTLVPAGRAARRAMARVGRDRGPSSPSMAGRALASLPAPLAMEIGVRMALEPGRGRSAVPVRSALAAATLAGAVAATLVFRQPGQHFPTPGSTARPGMPSSPRTTRRSATSASRSWPGTRGSRAWPSATPASSS